MMAEQVNTPLQTNTARLIRMHEATQKTGLSKSTIYELMAEGRFPGLVRLSVRCVAFVESEVDDWIAMRIADRNCEAQRAPLNELGRKFGKFGKYAGLNGAGSSK